jgi:hypothetical protein
MRCTICSFPCHETNTGRSITLTVLEAVMDGAGQSYASSGFCSGAARDLCVALRSGDPCRRSFQTLLVLRFTQFLTAALKSPGGGGGSTFVLMNLCLSCSDEAARPTDCGSIPARQRQETLLFCKAPRSLLGLSNGLLNRHRTLCPGVKRPGREAEHLAPSDVEINNGGSYTVYLCVYCAVRTVFMCFVWISEQTAIISLYSIYWLYYSIRSIYINLWTFPSSNAFKLMYYI